MALDLVAKTREQLRYCIRTAENTRLTDKERDSAAEQIPALQARLRRLSTDGWLDLDPPEEFR